MTKRNLREHFIEGWNKLFGREEDKTKTTIPIDGRAPSLVLLAGGTIGAPLCVV